MAPVTSFYVEDPYIYMNGFNGYHQSEAVARANPSVINSPQNPPFGLRTERISNSSFVAPSRERNFHTWLYRINSSLQRTHFTLLDSTSESANPPVPNHITPDSYIWPTIPVADGADWTQQKLLGRNGDPQKKSGCAIWVFSVTGDMSARTAFSCLDGEMLIVPQSGALDIQTEVGKLVIRQNEIAVIPRGIRHRVTLKAGRPARGYVFELFEGHFELPALGVIGSTGLANVRDFQIPVAHFDGNVVEDDQGDKVVKASDDGDWRIISRLNGQLWTCMQNHTPFDVVAWHGTCYPYKYDLARFCVMGNTLFDHHDPSLYTVLTAPSYGKAPGTAVMDFAVVPPRWQVAKDSLWIPYYHRNVMQEFFFPIIYEQSPSIPFNSGHEFGPFVGGLHGSMVAHGSPENEYLRATDIDTTKPIKVNADGMMIALVETELPFYLSKWAFQSAVKNFNGKTSSKL
ncbi:homogentisate 1,2-dioxygenase [Xylaria bambusicola]|uniref:homogentisate 1,2-dioxygenase n=1 Tax=Xylaria bambusicola TaxID=326684 RepID=UPI002007C9BE|nr:homogentisate 1,2-dioxygenase [Xylaria bambusicola]KAI0506021.1 homogentisate 1,2-dioxygenase [Xylaria bambusicola]